MRFYPILLVVDSDSFRYAMTTPNPFLDFLDFDETGRRAAFFGRSEQFGRSQQQRNFYQNAFSELYNNYLGNLGRQAIGGNQPTGTFNDYLGGLDYDTYYRQQVPYRERTQGFSSFVPATQWRVVDR